MFAIRAIVRLAEPVFGSNKDVSAGGAFWARIA
jgi:hypothetical protein